MWSEICDNYYKVKTEIGDKFVKRKHYPIPKTMFGWCIKSKYYKLMCHIETMYSEKQRRLHLDNGIILDFENMIITHEDTGNKNLSNR